MPARSAPLAQPASTAVSSRRPAIRLFASVITVDDIDATRYTERELLIGYSLIFLQVRKRDGRIAPLAVACRQPAHLQRRGVQGQNQVFVLRLRAAWSQLQRRRARDGGIGICRREIAGDIALSRKE